MRSTAILLGLLAVLLCSSAYALPVELTLQQMYMSGQGWPPSLIEFSSGAIFDKVVFKPCIAHDHNPYNGLTFTLFKNGTKVYETSWSRVVVNECPSLEFENPLNNTFADNFTWGGYLGSQTWGFYYLELRLNPKYSAFGSIVTSDEPKSFGAINEMLNINPKSNYFKVDSPSKNVIVWIEDEETEALDYSRKGTSNPEETVFACADTNNNTICDVNEGSFRSCSDAGGDWFRGYCCGVNYTSCQYVGKIPIPYTERVCTRYIFWGGCTSYSTITRYNNITINAICGNNSQGNWEWVPAEGAGEIHEMSCPNGSTVANGSAIFNCGDPMEGATLPFGDFRTIKMGSLSHEYTCKDKTVYECSGASGSFSSINGLAVGTTNPSFTNQTYYCASDGDWTTDLDVKDKESCELAGFAWTGSMCCSEADDVHEYYNDPAFPEAEGGCWDKTFIRNGEFSIGSRIINYRGKFYGCRVREDSLVLLTDAHSGERLIDNSVLPCGQVLMDVKPGGLPHAVCHPDGQNGRWIFTDEPGGTINKSIKWLPSSMKGISQTGCCAYDQCWNGTRCQQLDAFYRVADQGYICKIGPQPQAPVVCDLSSDCPQGLMCQGNYCVPLPAGSCVHDNDCGQNLDCVSNVCVPSHCSNNNPCPSGFNCANNNKCTIAV